MGLMLLFINYSSAFNTIILDILTNKLLHLGLSTPICIWAKDFLMNRSIGAPQGCVLSPLLYSLYTYSYIPAHQSNTFNKFADDATVVGLISEDNETQYRDDETDSMVSKKQPATAHDNN